MPDQIQRDVIKESRAPVVASHSNTRSLVNISRNIPDDILKRIAEKGGAVMVTFDSGMLSSDYHPPSKERAPIGILIDHIDHVAKLVGIDHVGIGSDFMGSGINSPKGLETAAGFPLITYHLLKRGYTEDDIQKIMGGNLLRVLKTVQDKSTRSK